jgi:MraZ protein
MLKSNYGYWDVTMEKSGRMKLPAALLKQLSEDDRAIFFVTRGFGSYISLWTNSSYQEQTAYLDTLDYNIIENRIYRNAFLKNLVAIECDAQNRFMIPRSLLEYYKIDRNVVLILSKGQIEIWSQESYNAQFDLSPEDFAKLNEKISINNRRKEEDTHDRLS